MESMEAATHLLAAPVPFEDPAHVQHLLETKLTREEIASRAGAGSSQVSYIEAWRVIEKAQHIFGFDGWSTEIRDIQQEYEEKAQGTARWTTGARARPRPSPHRHKALGPFKRTHCERLFSRVAGYSCIVRVILKDGTFHEDVGFGSVCNEKDRGKAIENARKEASLSTCLHQPTPASPHPPTLALCQEASLSTTHPSAPPHPPTVAWCRPPTLSPRARVLHAHTPPRRRPTGHLGRCQARAPLLWRGARQLCVRQAAREGR